MYQIPTLAERQRTRNCHNCRVPAFAELGTDGSACALMWVWGLGCTTPGPSQLQSSQGDEEGCIPLPRAAGSCPAWKTRDWESAEVSICWLQHAFLVVHGSGGRKERDDKNKAADLYLAINHSRVIFFFSIVFEDYAINELVHEFFISYHYSFDGVARLLWHFHSSGSLCLGGELVNPLCQCQEIWSGALSSKISMCNLSKSLCNW